MNLRLQMRILGFALLCVALIIIGPILTNLRFNENNVLAWIICAAIPMILSAGLLYYSRGYSQNIHHRDAIASILTSWITVMTVGSLPYLLVARMGSFCDAFFESVTGYTSTGWSIFQTVEQLPNSLLLYRALTQWIGGLGIIVLLVFAMPTGACTKKMYDNETSVLNNELTAYSAKRLSYIIPGIYGILTLSCALLFHFFGMSTFDAICHALTTVSTGGLSNHNEGFMYFQSVGIKCTAIIFMLIGGTNFQIISSIFSLKQTTLKRNDEFKAYIIICMIFSVILFVINKKTLSCIDSIFQVVSLITTTGFSITDHTITLPVSYVLFFAAMLIGGCTGSTAGGIKIARILIVLKSIGQQIGRVFRPHLVCTLRINHNAIPQDMIINQLSLLCLYPILIILAILMIGLAQPLLDASGLLAIVTASLSNSGVVLGGNIGNVAALHNFTKIILCFLMLLGRLEIYPIFFIFLYPFWRKRKRTLKNA